MVFYYNNKKENDECVFLKEKGYDFGIASLALSAI